jgi:hypothetical protein
MKNTIFVFTFLFVSLAQATTYYVDRLKPGRDSNSGTSESAPFLTIAKCVGVAINPGDTCLVKNGNYPEPWTMQFSGTSASPITIKNYPGHSPTIKFQEADPTAVVHTSANPPNLGHQLILLGGGIYDSKHTIGWIVIEGFEVSNGYAAFPCYNCHDIVYRNNTIHHMLVGAYGGNGIRIVIDRNRMYHNGRFASCTAYPPGTKDPYWGVNTCNQDQQIYYRGTYFTITNNLLYDGLSYGIQVAGYGTNATDPSPAFTGASNWRIANNTVAYQHYRHAMNLWDGGGGCTNITVENNIFYENARKCPGCGNGVDIFSSSTSNIIRNNIMYATSASGAIPIQNGTNGVNYTATNNFFTNPNMGNAPATMPAAPDFRLTQNSLVAIDKGISIDKVLFPMLAVDFTGLTTRPQGKGFDIGAYEFTSAAEVKPLAPKNLTVK